MSEYRQPLVAAGRDDRHTIIRYQVVLVPMREAVEPYMWPGSGRHLLRNVSVAGGIDKAEDEQPTEDRQLAEPEEQHHEQTRDRQSGAIIAAPGPLAIVEYGTGHGSAKSHGPAKSTASGHARLRESA